ncbi:hypothetical protein GW813_12735 [bacterium]|nr:hypothetical protein [bacterium]
MNTPTIRQLILPSLCADALALGIHWIYNPAKIARLYPAASRIAPQLAALVGRPLNTRITAYCMRVPIATIAKLRQ